MSTINQLLKTVEQISVISGCNGHFTEGLARRIDETGYDLDDLKISELIAITEQHRELYNNSLSGNPSSTPTQYKAKQAVDALKYISMSIKTVQNDIEALYGQEHKRSVAGLVSASTDINNHLKSINNDFNSLVDKSKSMANVSMDCKRLHEYLSSIHAQIIDALSTTNSLERVCLDFVSKNNLSMGGES